MDRYSWFVEEVRGVIVGGETWPYEFWTLPQHGPVRRIDKGHFKNDAAAVKWFKARYPREFALGAEMRVFDQPER